KFYEVQSHLTISNHVYTPFVLLASKRWWDTLTPDERDVITQAAKTSQAYQRKISREADSAALQYIKDQGVEGSRLGRAETDKMRETLAPRVAKLRVELGPETVDGSMTAAQQAAQQ